jgi:hypothetical protein
MKQKPDEQLSKKVIPDGEGFNALPIAFNSVIARNVRCDEAIPLFR